MFEYRILVSCTTQISFDVSISWNWKVYKLAWGKIGKTDVKGAETFPIFHLKWSTESKVAFSYSNASLTSKILSDFNDHTSKKKYQEKKNEIWKAEKVQFKKHCQHPIVASTPPPPHIHTHTHTHTNIRTHTNTHTHTHTQTYTHTNTHTLTHTHKQTNTNKQKHTQTHTHTHYGSKISSNVTIVTIHVGVLMGWGRRGHVIWFQSSHCLRGETQTVPSHRRNPNWSWKLLGAKNKSRWAPQVCL